MSFDGTELNRHFHFSFTFPFYVLFFDFANFNELTAARKRGPEAKREKEKEILEVANDAV